MDYINRYSKQLNASVHYGTFADYVKAVHSLNLTWPVETKDFFPYTDGGTWSGK